VPGKPDAILHALLFVLNTPQTSHKVLGKNSNLKEQLIVMAY
jgi:hypothetical protein